MKRILALCLVVIPLCFESTVASAQPDDRRFRVGIDAAWMQSEFGSYFVAVDSGPNVLLYVSGEFKDSFVAPELNIEYDFDERWSAGLSVVPSASWTRRGTWSVSQVVPLAPPGGPTTQDVRMEWQSVELTAAYRRPVNDHLAMYGRLGAIWTSVEPRLILTPGQIMAGQTLMEPPQSFTDTRPTVAIGSRYRFDAGPEAFAELAGGTEGFMAVRLGVAWRF